MNNDSILAQLSSKHGVVCLPVQEKVAQKQKSQHSLCAHSGFVLLHSIYAKDEGLQTEHSELPSRIP